MSKSTPSTALLCDLLSGANPAALARLLALADAELDARRGALGTDEANAAARRIAALAHADYEVTAAAVDALDDEDDEHVTAIRWMEQDAAFALGLAAGLRVFAVTERPDAA